MAAAGRGGENLRNPPELYEDLGWAYEAFCELSADRQVGLGSAGMIPWSSIDRYAVRNGIEGDAFDSFLYLIRAMDGAWLELQAEAKDRRGKK